jgi:hypothetical protein
MAFIRKRLSSDHRLDGKCYSYQLIETFREGGKVKQRVLANLGRSPTIADAIEWERAFIQRTKTGIKTKMPFLGVEVMRHLTASIAESEAYITKLEGLQAVKPRRNFVV